ncbi:MAG: 30S ribosomal protein S16 [Vicingaceae bacterium]
MPTKIRLQRHGKKKYAYFHLVIADSRAPRDGKFIEKIGTYNPNTDPATIDIDFDRALNWVKNGAQPSDTARALLSYKGVMYKHHLDRGVLKGAFSQEEADKRFEDWLADKANKIDAKRENLTVAEEAEKKKRFEAEQEANKKKAESIAAKTAELAGEATEAAEEAVEEASEAVSEATEEVKDTAKEVAEEAKETAKEVVEEAKDTTEEVAEEVKETAKDAAEDVKKTVSGEEDKKEDEADDKKAE